METLEMMQTSANESIIALKIKIQSVLIRFIWPTDTYLDLPELSHHAVLVAFLSCVVLISLDAASIILNDDNIVHVRLSLNLCLFAFFFIFMHPWVEFFSQPLIGKPSYANFNKW